MLPTEAARRTRISVAAVVALVAFTAYARVLGLGFAYDDHWTVLDNAALAQPLTKLLAVIAQGQPEMLAIPDSTRPVMLASLWIDRRLFGTSALGHHLTSLVLYALACGAASSFLLQVSRRVRVALAGGIFFALAPVHAEAVAAVNYREDLLAGLGVLVASSWSFAPRTRPERWSTACAAAACFLAGLLAKESAVALLPIVLGLALLAGRDRDWFAARNKTFTALGAVLVGYGAWRLSLRLRGLDNVPLAPRLDVWTRVTSTARYELESLASSLLPFAWSPEYEPRGAASTLWLLGSIVVIAATVALSLRRSTRPLGLGIAFAMLAALPSSPLVAPANERADRYLFLSVLGGALVWGALAEQALAIARMRGGTARIALPLLPLYALSAFVTQSAVSAWRDDLTLWSVAAAKAPASYRSWVGLSRAQRLAGDQDGALASVERALALRPDSLSAHVTRAYARLARGDVAGARADIARVRELGGARQRGLAHAARCAELPAERARECIDGKRGAVY